ncbi:MAG: hypothetical protein KDK29_19260, partial [Sedimentitalea sp.]|nr:hypothetical protein [Sedimentitalea sp.]
GKPGAVHNVCSGVLKQTWEAPRDGFRLEMQVVEHIEGVGSMLLANRSQQTLERVAFGVEPSAKPVQGEVEERHA